MENSPFGSLFGNATASATVVDEPPPSQLDPFKIPMKIVEHVINNRYSGDGTLQVRFIKIVVRYITFGLMMERVLPKHGGD
jgi:hypothetical protein